MRYIVSVYLTEKFPTLVTQILRPIMVYDLPHLAWLEFSPVIFQTTLAAQGRSGGGRGCGGKTPVICFLRLHFDSLARSSRNRWQRWVTRKLEGEGEQISF